jgi:hypothetical protein
MNKQKIILKLLNKEFGNLTPVVKDYVTNYIDKNRFPVFYKYHDEEYGGNIYFDYSRIWLLLESIFGMEISEIRNLLKIWLEETYNMGEVTPRFSLSKIHFRNLK